MSIKAKPTVQDILARFNSAMKTAEDATELQDTGVLSDPEPNDASAEVGKEKAAPAPADDVAELNKDKERGEDAGQVLGAIAKEAAEAHRNALQKEAAVFGEIFAKAAVDQMNKLAAEKDAQLMKEAQAQEEQYIYVLCKQAADEAYMNTMQAMQGVPSPEMGGMPAPEMGGMPEGGVPEDAIAQEAYDNTMGELSQPEATLGDAADAVTTSAEAALQAAKAATALTKAVQEQATEPESEPEPAPEPAPEDRYDPEAAQEAYDNTMAYMQQPQVEPDPAQEEAYANTMAALQGQG